MLIDFTEVFTPPDARDRPPPAVRDEGASIVGGTWVRVGVFGVTQVFTRKVSAGKFYLLVVLELAHFLAMRGIRLYQFLF